MKKKKILAILLTASLLSSVTGCSGNKKQILEAVDNYAKALLEADVGDIADLMADGDEFEESFESFQDRYNGKEDLEDVYAFILENTTYKIDTKSVEIKDKIATVSITFTMVDYMDVYDNLDDDPDAEDFLEELEDNTDNTMEIDQKIELKLVKDEWKIVDDDFENVSEIYEFYGDITSLGLGGITFITSDEFTDAVIAAAGADVHILSEDHYEFMAYTYGGTSLEIVYMIYDDEEDAIEEYEDICDDFRDLVDDGDFEGDYYFDTDYLTVDGTINDGGLLYSMYGGIYCVDGTIVYAFARDYNSGEKDMAETFLQEIGYPMP